MRLDRISIYLARTEKTSNVYSLLTGNPLGQHERQRRTMGLTLRWILGKYVVRMGSKWNLLNIVPIIITIGVNPSGSSAIMLVNYLHLFTTFTAISCIFYLINTTLIYVCNIHYILCEVRDFIKNSLHQVDKMICIK
jgi:ABC-type transport system involved in Fe-S cluster assembly fused permease/ATPase subunit